MADRSLDVLEEMIYFISMKVAYGKNADVFVCPRCKHTLMRKYQKFCGDCGQKLSWEVTSYS